MKNLFRQRKKFAFTLVELLVVVVIIGILAAIALPNYVGAQAKARTASVKGNMRTVQIAAESYATDASGVYPNSCAVGAGGCGAYFPGGGNSPAGLVGTYPTNPVTALANQPGAQGLSTSAGIMTQRQQLAAGVNFGGGPGNLSYDLCDAGNSYAVCGGDTFGKFIPAAGGRCSVLSNQ